MFAVAAVLMLLSSPVGEIVETTHDHHATWMLQLVT